METKRLILRALEESDAEDIYEYAKDLDIGPSAGWKVHTSIANSQEIIRDILMVEHNFGIVDKQNNRVIGLVGLKPDTRRDADTTLELGYWLGKPYWGKGLIVEASICVMRYAYEVLQKDIVTIWHYQENTKSKRVIEKLHFIYEGTLRNVEKDVYGKLVTGVFYSQSRAEFEQYHK
ncbi:MAG: GNAT family N-acetyltransferase [Breznakia sp.]